MVGFIPVEEVERSLVVPRDMAEKEVRDFYREELVEEAGNPLLMEDLVVAVVQVISSEEVVVEGTLVEAVEVIKRTPVGEGEDLTTPEQIRKLNVVSKQPAMVA